MIINKTYGELKEGEVIYVQGHPFMATEVRKQRYDNDKADTVRFKGICTDDKRNDNIKHTGYNGGIYGGYDWVEIAIEAAIEAVI